MKVLIHNGERFTETECRKTVEKVAKILRRRDRLVLEMLLELALKTATIEEL